MRNRFAAGVGHCLPSSLFDFRRCAMAGRLVSRILPVAAIVAAVVGLALVAPAASALAGGSSTSKAPSLTNTSPCSTDLSPGTFPTGPAVVSSAPTPYGQALVVGAGPYAGCSLYYLTSDSPPTGYGCSALCAYTLWPALVTDGAPKAGPGVNPTLLGTVTRTDIFTGESLTQVTYAGHPLYRFFLDATAGQTFGEEIFDPVVVPNGIWYLLSPGRGTPDVATATLKVQTVPLVHLGTTTPYGSRPALTVTLDQGIGGLTFPVYTFSADAHNKSSCNTATCSLFWPPLLTSGTPIATGTVGGSLGIAGRPQGVHQVTFDGHPLYVFVADTYLPPFGISFFGARGTGVTAFGGTFKLAPWVGG
jgi:predicted lipoprotein with Yx(FWY)xxD motif